MPMIPCMSAKVELLTSQSRFWATQKNRFIVPKYFFAAVMIKNKSGHKAIGFWFEHKVYPSTEKLSAHIVNIAKLEELTGIDFFCNLPDDEERQIENVNITPSYLQTVWKITN